MAAVVVVMLGQRGGVVVAKDGPWMGSWLCWCGGSKNATAWTRLRGALTHQVASQVSTWAMVPRVLGLVLALVLVPVVVM